MIEVPLSPVEAALGAEIDVPVLDGRVRMRVPPGDAGGLAVSPARQGVSARDGARGDAHVRVAVEDARRRFRMRRKALLERLGELLTDDALPRRRTFREASKRAKPEEP
jgi:molecular chaperone DnaJ